MPLEPLLITCALLPALAMAPQRTLRASGLQNPWLASLGPLPVRCATQRALPGGLVLPMSGTCLMVLMFGWPLAVLSLALIAITGAWSAGDSLAHAVNALAWNGVLPATLAPGLGLATRRWLAQHVFVYILGRGCSVTTVAIVVVWRSRTTGLPSLRVTFKQPKLVTWAAKSSHTYWPNPKTVMHQVTRASSQW